MAGMRGGYVKMPHAQDHGFSSDVKPDPSQMNKYDCETPVVSVEHHTGLEVDRPKTR